MDYNFVFQTLLIQQEETHADACDRATTPKAQQLVIAFAAITEERNQRLELASEVVGRHLNSFLDLKVGEIDVLLKLLDQPNFVATMREEMN